MLTNQNIRQIFQEFFEKMAINPDLPILKIRDKTIELELFFEDPRPFIGSKGQGLLALEHILRALLIKKTKTLIWLDLDINGYKKKKNAYLKELAKNTADQVSFSKKEIELTPMSPQERRIIHLELSQRTDVFTESIGQGLQRRVVIKPK